MMMILEYLSLRSLVMGHILLQLPVIMSLLTKSIHPRKKYGRHSPVSGMPPLFRSNVSGLWNGILKNLRRLAGLVLYMYIRSKSQET